MSIERPDEQHLLELAGRSALMLSYWGADLRCRYATPAYAARFGVDAVSLIGKSLFGLLGAASFPAHAAAVTSALKGQVQTVVETSPGSPASGLACRFQTHYQPDILDVKVVGILVLLTELEPVQKEDVVVPAPPAQDRTQIELNRLAAIVESSHDAIVGKTLDGRITSWNAGAERLFGYEAADAIGQPVQMLIPPERQDEEMRILATLARGVRVTEFDTVRCAQDGRLLDVAITISPIRDATGRIVGASKIVRDNRERRQAEQSRDLALRLQAENRQIQESSRLKSLFLANVSHELRTPLNAIIGFSDLMLSGKIGPDSPKTAVFLGHIAGSGRHLLSLINDLLDSSKIEAGKFEFFPQPINLSSLVHEIVGVLGSDIESRNIVLTSDVDAEVEKLVLDPLRLKQVLYNLLANAIKFTPDHGRVAVRAHAVAEGYFRLEVQDSGVGIEAELLPQLFIEFQQIGADGSPAHKGTGLGLALTRRLVEAQGGSVGVTSELGRGSTFHLVLRRRQDLNHCHGSTRPAPRRLLVIQEDPQLQARLTQELANAGFEVAAAATAAHAALLADSQPYHGYAVGVPTPTLSGSRLLADVGLDTQAARPPVVGVSVPCGPGSAAWFAIADILSKPIRPQEIRASFNACRPGRNADGPVMVIDDDAMALELMQSELQVVGLDAACFVEGRQALKEIEYVKPRAIILDLMMPQFDGFQVLGELDKLPQASGIPVYIWTSMTLTTEEFLRLSRSACAIVEKGGGTLETMLHRLRRWTPAVPASSRAG